MGSGPGCEVLVELVDPVAAEPEPEEPLDWFLSISTITFHTLSSDAGITLLA